LFVPDNSTARSASFTASRPFRRSARASVACEIQHGVVHLQYPHAGGELKAGGRNLRVHPGVIPLPNEIRYKSVGAPVSALSPPRGERIPRPFDALCAPEPDEVVKNSHSSQHAVVRVFANVVFWRFRGRESLLAGRDQSLNGEPVPTRAGMLPAPEPSPENGFGLLHWNGYG
jgi:hypothetical protein